MPHRTHWLEMALVAAFCAFLFFYGLGALGLMGADEPRYAQIAREMLHRRDWVTPVLYGVPWLEKPVLYYWQAMVAYRIFGVSDWAARIPSAVSASLMVAATYCFSLRIRRGMQLDAALLTASCALVLGMARAASTDMPLTAPFAIAMLCWYAWRESGRRWLLLAFYFMLALGTLAKGPVAPFLAAAIVIAFCLMVGEPAQLRRTLWPPGLLLFLAVALPWYVVVQLRNPQFFRFFILEHNLGRFSSNMFRHKQPFWYYVPVVLLATAPWSAFVIAGFADAIQRWRAWRGKSTGLDPLAAFLLLWAVLPIVFFSMSQSKLPAYILPSVPACALLAAVYVHEQLAMRKRPAFWMVGLHAALCALMIAGVVLAPALVRKVPATSQAMMVASGAASLTFIAVTALLLVKGYPMLRTVTLFPVVIALGFVIRVAAPAVDAVQSERPLARLLQSLEVEPGERVALFHAKREVEYGLAFYRNQPIAVYDRLEIPRTAHVLVAAEGSQEQLRELLPGRNLRMTGIYTPQSLQIFAVDAAK